MSSVVYPSVDFPGQPKVSLALPERWLPRAVLNTFAAWVLPNDDGSYASNVVLDIRRFPGGRTLDETSTALDAVIADLDQSELATNLVVEINGRQWAVREFAFVHPEVGTLLQLIAATNVRNGNFTDTVQLTASVAPAHQDRDSDVVRGIFKSAEVEASLTA